MRLLLRTHSSDEHYNADCDFAIVEIDAALAHRIAERRRLFEEIKARDGELAKLVFWDAAARYYANRGDELPEDFQTMVDRTWDEDYVPIPDADELPKALHAPGDDGLERRTECDQLVVYDTSFEWRCYPKHADITISTPCLSFDDLEKIMASLAEAAAKKPQCAKCGRALDDEGECPGGCSQPPAEPGPSPRG